MCAETTHTVPAVAVDHPARSLSRRESQIVSWLAEEQLALVRAADLSERFGLGGATASDVLRRMAAKGWLARVAQGAYEPLLLDSGGYALPNPWAALAAWRVPYYVSYASAAYELGLTPDRPASVQACVPFATRTPARFRGLPLTLIPQRTFSPKGASTSQVQGQTVRIAGVEKMLLDSAIRPARVGGAIPLARIAHRASGDADWAKVVALADAHPRGGPAIRRLAALLTLLEDPVPGLLGDYARRRRPSRPMLLDDRSIYGRRGPLLEDWRVVVNVPPQALREELSR